ncbi:hypothetical protein GE061_004882, partial [Apolygus lucorum]
LEGNEKADREAGRVRRAANLLLGYRTMYSDCSQEMMRRLREEWRTEYGLRGGPGEWTRAIFGKPADKPWFHNHRELSNKQITDINRILSGHANNNQFKNRMKPATHSPICNHAQNDDYCLLVVIMGNVHGASAKPTDDFQGFSAGMPSPPSEDILENLENPGKMDDLHKKCKEIFPANFEGAKIAVQKGLSNHFQISHSLNMSSLTPSGYRFGATYVGTQQYGQGEVYPILVGDVDPSGNLNANMYHKFTNEITSSLQAQVSTDNQVLFYFKIIFFVTTVQVEKN